MGRRRQIAACVGSRRNRKAYCRHQAIVIVMDVWGLGGNRQNPRKCIWPCDGGRIGFLQGKNRFQRDPTRTITDNDDCIPSPGKPYAVRSLQARAATQAREAWNRVV